jgi:hypothetical protein
VRRFHIIFFSKRSLRWSCSSCQAKFLFASVSPTVPVCCPFILFELHTVPVPVKSVRGNVQCNANQQESQQSEKNVKPNVKNSRCPTVLNFRYRPYHLPDFQFLQTTETSYSITGVKVIGDMCHHNERIFIPVPFFSAKLNIKTRVN